MGKELYQQYPLFRQTIDQAEAYLDFDLKKIMFEDPGGCIGRTEYTQPVLASYAAGITALLRQAHLVPAYTAGLSLGEYSALYGAGVFDLEGLVRVTAFRGAAMARASKGTSAKMCAVIGISGDLVDRVCRQIREQTGGLLVPANYNSARQTVISGDSCSVDLAVTALKEAGARRCMPLKVSGPFHTPLMKSAGDALEKLFVEKPHLLHEMKVPVVFNTLGTVSDDSSAEAISNLLVRQVQSPTRMAQTITFLENQGVEKIIEIGPGRTLSGFVKRTAPKIQTISADSPQDIEKLMQEA